MKTSAKSLLAPLIGTLCTAIFLLLWGRGFEPLQQLEFSAQDWLTRLGRLTPADERLVLIGIDKAIYDADFSDEEVLREPLLRHLRNTYPWSREVWSRLIEKLSAAGAKAIVFDLVFASKNEGDDALQSALQKYRDRVVIGYDISGQAKERGDSISLQLPNPALFLANETNVSVQDDRCGFVNIWPDGDETLRRARYRMTGQDAGDVVAANTVLFSIDALALKKFGRGDLIPDGTGARLFRYTAPPGVAFKPHPVGDVLSPKLWESNYGGGKFFAGKIVFIGPTAEIFQDSHNTPFNHPKAMAGPEIHLQIINAALNGEFLREPALPFNGALIVLAGLIGTLLCQFFTAPLMRLLVILLLGVGFFFMAIVGFNRFGMFLPVMTPMLTLFTIGGAALVYDFISERLERMKLRHTMGLYFSPRVMEAVLSDPGSMQPRRADVVLLLTDLRNSTPLAEQLGPHGMFQLLNQVFEAQTEAIMSEEGNLEHFLGDQFLSYWGAPQTQPDAADRAGRAAMKLIHAMEKLRVTLSPEVQKIFGYGVALHSGSVLVGNKGSARRLDYGLVGDVVNEAARVEALTKYYGVKFLCTRETVAQFTMQPAHRLIDRVIVKGKSAPVELFECENPCAAENFPELCRRYKAAYDEYFFGRFDAAEKQFEKLIADFSDGASKILAARCGELVKNPPLNWHGVWKMDAK